MNTFRLIAATSPWVVSLVSGCNSDPTETKAPDEELGIMAAALEGENALTPNALTPNALTPNALTQSAFAFNGFAPSALAQSALTPDALTQTVMSSLKDPGTTGVLSRMFLKYTVGCAFDATQSFDFSWIDVLGIVHEEVYQGRLGLSPDWATKAPSKTDQLWISACLAARTNWYGTSVTISARASHPALNKAGAPELSTYTREEGAFWGNLFAPTPALYACHHTPNNTHSRALSRDCASGHEDALSAIDECGPIHIIGACSTHCTQLSVAGQYHPSCTHDPSAGQSATSQVITVFLP